MTLITQKLQLIDTYRDPFANGSKGIDMTLTLGYVPNIRPSNGSIKTGNVVRVDNIGTAVNPNIPSVPLSDIRGYYFVEDVWIDSGNNTGALYLFTGRTIVSYKDDEKFKGALLTINNNTNDNNLPNIAGWQKNAATANKYMNEAAGKFANCQRIYEWIKNEVIPDSNYVKERQNIANFENIIADLEDWWWYAQAAYNQCDGIKNAKTPFITDQYDRLAVSNKIKLAAQRMKRAEDDFLKKERNIKDWAKVTNLEKAWQAAKTVLNAPARGLMQFIIQNNVKGVGSAYYALQQASEKDGAGSQKRKEYDKMANNWYKSGGNKTTFNEMIRIGGNKKEVGFDSSYSSADGNENDTIKLPVGLGSTAAAAAVLLAGLNPVTLPSVAVWGPEALSVGGAIDGAIVVINGLNIKKGGKENDETITPPTPTPTTITPPTDPKSTMMFDWEKYKVPIIGGGSLLAIGVTLYIFRDKIFK